MATRRKLLTWYCKPSMAEREVWPALDSSIVLFFNFPFFLLSGKKKKKFIVIAFQVNIFLIPTPAITYIHDSITTQKEVTYRNRHVFVKLLCDNASGRL